MIKHEELCQLIPHSFDMCLIDRVDFWDETNITCHSLSHTLATNPLRKRKSLSSVHVIEYAAQAMAIHGGLHDRAKGNKMTEGYLAALRDVQLDLCAIDNIENELCIKATKLLSQGGNMIYEFSVSTSDLKLATGRATVVAINYEND